MEKENRELQQVLSMKGGMGEESYANNSKAQATLLSSSMPVLAKAALDLCATNLADTVTIADLGCSSGPNTLSAISKITSIIYGSCHSLDRSLPEFCIFLNDLPGNDFNTVFKSLTAFHEKMQDLHGPKFKPLYIAGVPGSFYGRLFPSKSLQFVHSSSSLHWLSQVPPELSEKANPPINKGKIYISKTGPPIVAKAYLNQFQRDFSLFLKSRAEEIVPGGRMVLTFNSRATADPSPDESCLLWDYLAQAFQVLVAEGHVDELKLDKYNVPYYEAYTEEIREEIEKEGSFDLDCIEVTSLPWNGVNGGKNYDRATTAKHISKCVQVINESLIQSYFGPEIIDPLFQRYTNILAANTMEVEHFSVVVSVTRKD